jgi:hypothetical protein
MAWNHALPVAADFGAFFPSLFAEKPPGRHTPTPKQELIGKEILALE